MSHHASGADDAAITDGDTADDGYITAEPAVIADPNWLSVFQVIHLYPVIHLGIPFFVVQGCIGVRREILGRKNTSWPMVMGQTSIMVRL